MDKKENNTRVLNLKSMLKLDFYRLFHTPALYIMLLIAAMIPALMASMTGEDGTIMYQNAWSLVESIGGSQVGENPMDFSGYANINMVFIFAGILMSIFIAHDYSSGFVKNIFTVHARKRDYVISKTLVGIVGGIGMIITYVIGLAVAGLLTGLSFEVNIEGLIYCLVSKAILMFVFCSLFLCVSVLFKNKLWLTIVFTFLFGMMLYPAGSIATLSSTVSTIITVLIASIAGSVILGTVGTQFLKKRDLI